MSTSLTPCFQKQLDFCFKDLTGLVMERIWDKSIKEKTLKNESKCISAYSLSNLGKDSPILMVHRAQEPGGYRKQSNSTKELLLLAQCEPLTGAFVGSNRHTQHRHTPLTFPQLANYPCPATLSRICCPSRSNSFILLWEKNKKLSWSCL